MGPRTKMDVATTLSLAAAVVAGVGLRLYLLGDQVLVDDEWHALHRVLRSAYVFPLFDDGWGGGEIHYSAAQVFYDRLLLRFGALTELTMRLPSLVAGIALIVAVPALGRKALRDDAATILAWLLAISPLLVFYSRYARPYSVALLCGSVAIFGFSEWWENRGRSRLHGWLYLLGTVGTAWTHPAMLPGLLAPFAFALGHMVVSPERRELRRRLGSLGAATAVAVALFVLVPALAGGRIASPLMHKPATMATFVGTAELWFGTGRTWAVALVALPVAALGATIVTRTRPTLAAYALVVATAQIATTLVLRPHGIRFPIVFARYNLLVLPLVLACVAVGLAAVLRSVRVRASVAAPVVAMMALAASPLPAIYFYPNSFTNHGSWQFDYHGDRYLSQFRPRTTSKLYAALGRLPPGTLTVAEAPWYFHWHSFAYLQRDHRQRVVIGAVTRPGSPSRDGETPSDVGGGSLRNLVHLYDPHEIAARGVDLVLLHRDLLQETAIPFSVQPVDTTAVEEFLRETYGVPVFDDGLIAAFATSRRGRDGLASPGRDA